MLKIRRYGVSAAAKGPTTQTNHLSWSMRWATQTTFSSTFGCASATFGVHFQAKHSSRANKRAGTNCMVVKKSRNFIFEFCKLLTTTCSADIKWVWAPGKMLSRASETSWLMCYSPSQNFHARSIQLYTYGWIERRLEFLGQGLALELLLLRP